jgi:hypothetical protein
MYPKKDLPRSSWMMLWRVPVRALLVGALAAVAAGLFGAACGSLLGLATGALWVCAVAWGIRGALAGLAAGAIVGALSGVYHVEAPVQHSEKSRPSSSHPGESSLPSAVLSRNGIHPDESEDEGRGSAEKVILRGRQMLFPVP